MSHVELVGILNATPDSFSGDGVSPAGKDYVQRVLQRADHLIKSGASLIDIGAQSTRPNAEERDVEQEWARLGPVLPELMARYDNKLSIDTFLPDIVHRAAELGIFTINDVTCFNNPAMIKLATKLGLGCIVSHLPEQFGQDIQGAHATDELLDSMETVKSELLARRQQMIAAGISPEKIILDPGIGFSKTPRLNQELLEFSAVLPGIPVMIGCSKKRFLGEHRMEKEPNQAAARTAIAAGARYLRVHNPEWYTNL